MNINPLTFKHHIPSLVVVPCDHLLSSTTVWKSHPHAWISSSQKKYRTTRFTLTSLGVNARLGHIFIWPFCCHSYYSTGCNHFFLTASVSCVTFSKFLWTTISANIWMCISWRKSLTPLGNALSTWMETIYE